MSEFETVAEQSLAVIPQVPAFSRTGKVDELVIVRERGWFPGRHADFVHCEEPLNEGARWILENNAWGFDAVHCVSLPGGRVVNGHTPLTRKGQMLYDLARPMGKLVAVEGVTDLPGGGKIGRYRMSRFRVMHCTAALLFFGEPSGLHHSHWLLQTVPKVQWLRDTGVEPERYIVANTIQPYQIDTLEALGISRDRLEIIERDEVVQFDRLFALYAPNEMTDDLRIYEELQAQAPTGGRGPQRIYVSRQDAREVRRFLNEDRVIEIVREHGFEVVVPSTLSFRDEILKFRDARIIMGPLGAGLYNAVFSRPEAHMIAMSESPYILDWPLQLASLRDHRLTYLLGNSFFSHDKAYRGTHNSWVIDTHFLRSFLAGL